MAQPGRRSMKPMSFATRSSPSGFAEASGEMTTTARAIRIANDHPAAPPFASFRFVPPIDQGRTCMIKASAATVIIASPIPISACTPSMAGTTIFQQCGAAQPQLEGSGQSGGHHGQPGRDSGNGQSGPCAAAGDQPVQSIADHGGQESHVEDVGAHHQQAAVLEEQSLHGDDRGHHQDRRPRVPARWPPARRPTSDRTCRPPPGS